MTILGRYISRRFLLALAFMLGTLALMALTLDLMDEADRVLDSDYGGVLGLLRYSALRLPDITQQVLPVSCLLGMLVVLNQFIRHREMVALWGSGFSPMSFMRTLIPVVLVLAAITLVNNDIAVPETRAVLRAWGVGEARKSGFIADDGTAAWLISGNDIVRAPKRADTDGRLHAITIFRRDADGRLIERIDAELATPQGAGWLLQHVIRHGVDPTERSEADELYWDGRIDLVALPLIASEMRDLRSSDLVQLIKNDGYGQRPVERYRTWLQARIASMLVPALMVFLAISLAQRFRRTAAFGTLLLTSVGIGFAFLALDGICLALGEVGLLPAWFAAWGPKLALACLIGAFIVHREG
ncbi:MAG: LptF/LptG family permease [Rhodospirillales bacterium]|nr:LptF/LptG family permease [Rhodospirillales bacterium]